MLSNSVEFFRIPPDSFGFSSILSVYLEIWSYSFIFSRILPDSFDIRSDFLEFVGFSRIVFGFFRIFSHFSGFSRIFLYTHNSLGIWSHTLSDIFHIFLYSLVLFRIFFIFFYILLFFRILCILFLILSDSLQLFSKSLGFTRNLSDSFELFSDSFEFSQIFKDYFEFCRIHTDSSYFLLSSWDLVGFSFVLSDL